MKVEVVFINRKVLIVSGSPGKAEDFDLRCDQFMLGAKEAGNQAEKIPFRKHRTPFIMHFSQAIPYPVFWARKRTMSNILNKMSKADVIVIMTPILSYTMDAQMKTLIDTVTLYTAVTNKDFYFIMTGTDSNRHVMEKALEGPRGLAIYFDGSNEKGIAFRNGT